ncbi:hypothetical protein D3C77_306740 [compost metagenome]
MQQLGCFPNRHIAANDNLLRSVVDLLARRLLRSVPAAAAFSPTIVLIIAWSVVVKASLARSVVIPLALALSLPLSLPLSLVSARRVIFITGLSRTRLCSLAGRPCRICVGTLSASLLRTSISLGVIPIPLLISAARPIVSFLRCLCSARLGGCFYIMCSIIHTYLLFLLIFCLAWRTAVRSKALTLIFTLAGTCTGPSFRRLASSCGSWRRRFSWRFRRFGTFPFGSSIVLNIFEKLFYPRYGIILHHAHVIVNGDIKPFKNRNNFLTAHIERFRIFIHPELIFVLLFTQYTPPPTFSRPFSESYRQIPDPSEPERLVPAYRRLNQAAPGRIR